jgi:hypothetical protein
VALLVAAAAPLAAQHHHEDAAPNTLTVEERTAGFRLLFDGRTTQGWRGWRRPAMPDGWQVVDGALTLVGRGGDIITEEQFASFELRLDWKVEPGGNSGIFFHISEDSSFAWSYESGPEMQVLDDARHRDGASRLTSAGACYGLYPAPPGVVRPAGEWNQVRLVVNGNLVEHWLNDRKIVEYELGSPDWEARVRASKFAQWPGFARTRRGYIALQDHGDRVEFRSIRVRVISER